jgi:hypothetical protein
VCPADEIEAAAYQEGLDMFERVHQIACSVEIQRVGLGLRIYSALGGNERTSRVKRPLLRRGIGYRSQFLNDRRNVKSLNGSHSARTGDS